MDVAGFGAAEADWLRRAFGRKNNRPLIELYRNMFKKGAAERGVPQATAEKIFKKFNGQYMFPESHAFAFGVTAYHMAWLKYYYPLEFFVAIFNQQPMGFYNPETLKEDARRHGIAVLNPDINAGGEKCTIKDASLLLGFLNVKGVGDAAASAIVEARKRGAFISLADAMDRTGLHREALENLVMAGAFDALGLAKAVFITLEDEFGHIPLVVWPATFARHRLALKEPVLKVRGQVSRREGTLNIVVSHAEPIEGPQKVPKAKDWG